MYCMRTHYIIKWWVFDVILSSIQLSQDLKLVMVDH